MPIRQPRPHACQFGKPLENALGATAALPFQASDEHFLQLFKIDSISNVVRADDRRRMRMT
jgi:hypothetical protein